MLQFEYKNIYCIFYPLHVLLRLYTIRITCENLSIPTLSLSSVMQNWKKITYSTYIHTFWPFSHLFDNPYSYWINLPESQKVLLNCSLPSPSYMWMWRVVQSLRLHKELLQHYTWTRLGINIHQRPRVKIPLTKQKYQIKKPQIQELVNVYVCVYHKFWLMLSVSHIHCTWSTARNYFNTIDQLLHICIIQYLIVHGNSSG